jgi:hypothetical protein
MKSFEKWTTEEVEMTFGIKNTETAEEMTIWENFRTTFTDTIHERAEALRKKLYKMADFWGEEDMKVFFLLPIIELVDFYKYDYYRTFMEATIEAELIDVQQQKHQIRGRVEMIVAKGKQKPQIPYFFLNEYKPQTKAQADPKGQLLSAMLVAQAKNNGKNLPIYGLYSIGQLWFFVVLIGKKYVVSGAYDATKPADLTNILHRLQYVKEFIETNL